MVLANLLFIFKDYVEKYVPKLFEIDMAKKIKDIKNPKASLVPTIIAVVLVLITTSRLNYSLSDYSIGFYLVWLGVICLVLYPIMNKNSMNSVSENNKEENSAEKIAKVEEPKAENTEVSENNNV